MGRVIGRLCGSDYLSTPLLELFVHPDFDMDVFQRLIAISDMTTDQLRNNLLGGNPNGRS